MPEHRIGTREEWQAARLELEQLEAEQAERDEEIKRKRRELPWVPVEKEYAFDTEDGKKQLAELFDGRSQLLAYNIMFGPDFETGACPGCTNLADGFEGLLLHMNKRDVTDRPAGGLQAADGLAVPLRVDLRHRLPVRLRACPPPGAGQADPRAPGDGAGPAGLAPVLGQPGRRPAHGRPARESRLHRVRAGERNRVPHLHGHGTRPVRRSLLQLPARPDAEAAARRAAQLPQGRVPGLRSPEVVPGPASRSPTRQPDVGADVACRVGQCGEPVGHGLEGGVQRVVLASQLTHAHLVGPDLSRQGGKEQLVLVAVVYGKLFAVAAEEGLDAWFSR